MSLSAVEPKSFLRGREQWSMEETPGTEEGSRCGRYERSFYGPQMVSDTSQSSEPMEYRHVSWVLREPRGGRTRHAPVTGRVPEDNRD